MNAFSQERAAVTAGGAATESSRSAVSWAAIFAGTVVAAATSLLLVALGSGLGLASVSPWPSSGASATTFSIMTAVWLIVVQWLACALGGYLTGRLRTRWVDLHTHEVFFRDTAHGFVTWALSTVLVVGFLSSAVSAVVGGSLRAASTVAAGAAHGAAQGATSAMPSGAMTGGTSTSSSPTAGASPMPTFAAGPVAPYEVDRLFRSATPNSTTSSADVHAESARILAKELSPGGVPPADRAYLIQLVSAQTAVSPEDAQKRVDEAISQVQAAELRARQEADAARKAATATAIFTALAMVVGAFVASIAAALGGRRRDEHL